MGFVIDASLHELYVGRILGFVVVLMQLCLSVSFFTCDFLQSPFSVMMHESQSPCLVVKMTHSHLIMAPTHRDSQSHSTDSPTHRLPETHRLTDSQRRTGDTDYCWRLATQH